MLLQKSEVFMKEMHKEVNSIILSKKTSDLTLLQFKNAACCNSAGDIIFPPYLL